MEYRILGPLEVQEDGRERELGGTKQRALLAVLLLHANEVVSADRLIESLWGEHPPGTAAKTLQVHISRLRKALGREARLLSRAGGYVLELAPGELDLDRFRELADEGGLALARNEARAAEELLRKALSLWRGPPLANFAYESFAQPEIARLEELRLDALERRIEADLALGRHGSLIGELEALVREHPVRERLRAQLMLGLYRAGRQAEALECYQAARSALVDELGIEPGRPLRELHQQILRQDVALDLPAEPDASGEAARGAFVGRNAELAELEAGLEDALAGRGRLFLLVGEPGIGKSRLAEELVARARARSAQVLAGRCWEAGGAPAYWPWVQSLRGYVRETDAAALRSQLGAGGPDIAQIVPELRQRFPDLPERPSLDTEGARFRLFDATAEFLRNASRSRPIVLILDDLHAADAPSLLLLQFLVRQLGSTRILLVGAFRDVDPIPGQPFTALLGELAREPVTRRLSLGRLTEREVAEYVELSAAEIASPDLSAALHEETEGNPLFVVEMVRLIALERGTTAGARLTIPESVRDVIARRLAHLSQECNRMLVLASVLGREFALDALARLSGVSEDELLDTLDEAMAARVASDIPGTNRRLRFAHVLIRDTLYEGLSTARRVRVHRLAAEALEELYGDEPGPHLTELAYHAVAGSDFGKGLRYAQRAGDRAFALLAYEEAARLYQTALEALELTGPPDAGRRCELLIALGEAEARAGNVPAAKNAFLAAAEIARGVGLPRELARAAAGYGGRIVWGRAGDDERLVPLLEEGLEALGNADVELRARLLARLAGALRDEPSRGRRDALSREAVELARRTGNPAALAYALAGRSSAIVAPDTVAERLAIADELLEVAESIADRERVAEAHSVRLIAHLQVGDMRAAELDLAAATRIADELRQPAQLWQVISSRALLAVAAGRLDEAETLVPRAFSLGQHAQAGAIPVYQLQRYTLCELRGGLEAVEPAICDLVADYPARPVFRCVLAHLHGQLGRIPEARRAFADLAREDFSALPFDQEWLYGMSFLAETAVLVDDRDSTTTLYRLLGPWAATMAVDVGEGFRGSISRYLGMLAAAIERFGDAQRHFEDALTANEGMGARPWLARTQQDYAEMLLTRGAAGDRKKAHELLSEAIGTYEELGMPTHTGTASALAAETR